MNKTKILILFFSLFFTLTLVILVSDYKEDQEYKKEMYKAFENKCVAQYGNDNYVITHKKTLFKSYYLCTQKYYLPVEITMPLLKYYGKKTREIKKVCCYENMCCEEEDKCSVIIREY